MKLISPTFLTFLLLFIAQSSFAQTGAETPKISTDLPVVSRPSPTVAALVKFEEIPVSNYTGIPDISIPLYKLETQNKDIVVNLSLNYHVSDISITNIASWAGTGWSLMAGGVISRTIRGGYKDEEFMNSRGIYMNEYEDIFFGPGGNYLDIANITTYEGRKFLWDTHEKGENDSQYDLYQFNFMGYSGRFYINKQNQIVKLYNDTALKIEFDPSLKIFTLYDEKGNKYVFADKEATVELTVSRQSDRDQTTSGSPFSQVQYNSAFYLTDIYDINGIKLVHFDYIDSVEKYTDRILTKNYLEDENIVLSGLNISSPYADDVSYNIKQLLPRQKADDSEKTISTKKLSRINITGKAIVDFTTESGRKDINSEAVRLSGLIVKDLSGNPIKKYTFDHSYKGDGKRLVLDKVREQKADSNDNSEIAYTLEYNNIELLPSRNVGFYSDMDYWGYFNNSSNSAAGVNKQVDPKYCSTGALQKMILPTGGSIIFDFESNEYSYEGNTELTSFDNIKNRQPSSVSRIYTISSIQDSNSLYLNIQADQAFYFTVTTTGFGTQSNNINPVYNASAKGLQYFQFIPVKQSTSTNGIVSSYLIDNTRQSQFFRINEDLSGYPLANTYMRGISLKKGAYVIRLVSNPNSIALPGNFQGYYTVNFTYYNITNTYKYSYGGGVRIRYISYFKTNVLKNYYENNVNKLTLTPIVPDFEKKYEYHFFDDQYRSSGSLNFGKPIYEYHLNRRHLKRRRAFKDDGEQEGFFTYTSYELPYTVTTEYNNLQALKTRGADIGYKCVTVSTNKRTFIPLLTDFMGNISHKSLDNKDSGYSQYTYLSPIDYPETTYTVQYPFLPSENFDYKRGHLKLEKHFNKSGQLKQTIAYDYDFIEDMKISGVRIYNTVNCSYAQIYESYSSYERNVNFSQQPVCEQLSCGWDCGMPELYINFRPVKEAFGWARLIKKITTDHLEDRNIEVKESYTYNNLNKKIATHTVETFISGTDVENLATLYTYDTDVNATVKNNLASIKKIEILKNGELIDKKQIIYNSLFQPYKVQAAKGSTNLEDKLEYLYDNLGNIIQVKQIGGSPIGYVWGYNSTLPIAVIENVAYNMLPQAKVAAVVNASAQTTGYDEAVLLQKLQELRDEIENTFPAAKVTTYTYKPLIGIASVTDSKNLKTTYHYDGFGRLEAVKDAEGNLLSENEYHYRP